jgi:hypothetical protein
VVGYQVGRCTKARFDRRDVLSRQEREEHPPFLFHRIPINRSAYILLVSLHVTIYLSSNRGNDKFPVGCLDERDDRFTCHRGGPTDCPGLFVRLDHHKKTFTKISAIDRDGSILCLIPSGNANLPDPMPISIPLPCIGSSSFKASSSDRYAKGCSSRHSSYRRAFLSKALTFGIPVFSLDLPRHLQKRINHFWIKLGPCQGANIFSNFVL